MSKLDKLNVTKLVRDKIEHVKADRMRSCFCKLLPTLNVFVRETMAPIQTPLLVIVSCWLLLLLHPRPLLQDLKLSPPLTLDAELLLLHAAAHAES